MVDEVKYKALAFRVNRIPKWSSDYRAKGVDWDFNLSQLRPWKWETALRHKEQSGCESGGKKQTEKWKWKCTWTWSENMCKTGVNNLLLQSQSALMYYCIKRQWHNNQSLSWENKHGRAMLRGGEVKLHISQFISRWGYPSRSAYGSLKCGWRVKQSLNDV